jgi:hypothetical protein
LTVHFRGSYVVLATIAIDGLSLMPFVTDIVKEYQRKHELLYFGYVAQWQPFQVAVLSRQILIHRDTSLPMDLFFQVHFPADCFGIVWMLIKGCINKLCGEAPIDLRMGVSDPVTHLVGLSETLIETQRKAAINTTWQPSQDTRKLED